MIDLISFVKEFLRPLTKFSMIYHVSHAFVGLIFLTVYLVIHGNEHFKFSCDDRIGDHGENRCLRDYNMSSNGLLGWFYWVYLSVPLLVLFIISVVITDKVTNVPKREKCKCHIHIYHLFRLVIRLVFYVAVVVAILIQKHTVFLKGPDDPFICFMGNFTVSCTDLQATDRHHLNIVSVVFPILGLIYTVAELIYFMVTWKKTTEKRAFMRKTTKRCEDCLYFVTKYRVFQGMTNDLYRLVSTTNLDLPPTEECISQNKFDVLILNHEDDLSNCKRIVKELITAKFEVWVKDEQWYDRLHEDIENGISSSSVIIALLSPKFKEPCLCSYGLSYAQKKSKEIIFIANEDYAENLSRAHSFLVGYKPVFHMDSVLKDFRGVLEAIRRYLDKDKKDLKSSPNFKAMKEIEGEAEKSTDGDIQLNSSQEQKGKTTHLTRSLSSSRICSDDIDKETDETPFKNCNSRDRTATVPPSKAVAGLPSDKATVPPSKAVAGLPSDKGEPDGVASEIVTTVATPQDEEDVPSWSPRDT